MTSSWGFDTRAVHFGQPPSILGRPTAPPLVDSAAFAYDSAEELEDVFAGRRPGFVYSRIANPTVAQFEARIAALEDGLGSVAVSSGMAAVTAALTALAQHGDSILFSRSLFGGTLLLATKNLPRFGIEPRFVDLDDPDAIARNADETTRAIFLESVGNPKLDVPPLKEIGKQAEKLGLPVVVDNTLATPVLCRPKAYGAAIVLHSTTKFINGTGTAVGGIVVDTGAYDWKRHADSDLAESVRRAGKFGFLVHLRKRIVQNLGSFMAPVVAWTQMQGVGTLGLRVLRQSENALALARYLQKHPKVSSVNYPGLESSLWRSTATQYLSPGYGGLLTMRLGSKERAYAALNRLDLVSQLANLGDCKTLAIAPFHTIYRDCSDEERDAAGVAADMIRVSVGIETEEDIIADFDQALGEL